MRFPIKYLFSKCTDLVTFTEEIFIFCLLNLILSRTKQCVGFNYFLRQKVNQFVDKAINVMVFVIKHINKSERRIRKIFFIIIENLVLF